MAGGFVIYADIERLKANRNSPAIMAATPISTTSLSAVFPNLREFGFINAGSYKTVYRVRLPDGVPEVLKVIRLPLEGVTEEEQALRRQELGRAQREVSLLRNCQSPFVVKLGSIAPVLRQLEGDDCVVYTEEFLPGRDLKAIISLSARPSAAEIKRLLACLIQAIRSLWTAQNTVHRDIKPGNIFATGMPARSYVLLDLGIAYNVKEPGLTAKPEFVPATPRYMAPEMLDPNFRENLSFRADLYAAGVTAFEFATGGTHPLARTADDLVQTITRILHQEPRRLAKERPDLPVSLANLIDQLNKKNPALRPGNLSLLLQQLA
jgi:serine/threonine protein kinase